MDKSSIIFVCEHGAAKSIIAAAFFNQMAEQNGLNLRAAARATNPDAELSEPTVQGLLKDGLLPTESRPQKLTLSDIESAAQIVSFCELPGEYKEMTFVEQWDDIPAVSEDYGKARTGIVQRIHHLIDRIRSST